jgi:predicted amidohydrolase YtcJ
MKETIMCKGCVGTLFTRELFALESFRPSRRELLRYGLAGGAAASMMGARPVFAADGGADVIFQNGTVIPMAGPPTPVEAVAVGQGKILALGSKADLAGLRTSATRVIDLQGRTLLPGLIDPHHHSCLAALAAELMADVGYTLYPTRADLTGALKALVAKTPPGQWVLCANFDNLLQGGDLSMAELDAISTQHPIFVWYINCHDGAANAKAFEAAKIPQDIGPLPKGGHFGRGPDGKLNGLIYEEPALLRLLQPVAPPITPALMAKALRDYTAKTAAVGNTTMHEPGTIQPAWIEGLVKLSPQLTARLSASLMEDSLEAGKAFLKPAPGGRAIEFPGSRFSLFGIKIVNDGSNQTETGAQTKPYLGSDRKGATNFSAAELKELVAAIKAAGLPVQIHCNGDASADDALDAIEAAYGANPPTGLNRIEHATMIRPDQIARMKRLGVEPSFLMNHVFLYGAAYRDQIFGPERAAFMDPAGACRDAGVPFTLHSDAPCSPIGPLRLIQAAVTRRCVVDGSVVGPDQAITVEQALAAVTTQAARQIGLDHRIGSLEVGKEADFTILEQDPRAVDPEKILAIKVSETWLAGDKVFG